MAISISKANKYFREEGIVSEDLQARVQELLQGIVVDKDTLDKKLAYLRENNIPVKKCIFYGRVSTVSAEQLRSIINQHGICEDFEEDHLKDGFVVYEEVFERKSATNILKRKKFMNTLERVKDGEFDFIVFKSVDRAFRDVDNLMKEMKALSALGKGFIFYYDDKNSLNEDDRNEIIDRANKAEEYSNKLSKNVKRSRQRRIDRGQGMVPNYCFGYIKPKTYNGSELYIDESEANIVRQLYDKFLSGCSLSELALWLREQGVKTKLGKDFKIDPLRRILQNPIYTGLLRTNTKARNSVRDDWKRVDPNEYNYTPRPDLRIISDEVYAAAQIRFRENRLYSQNAPKTVPFKGLIKCECCGKYFRHIYNNTSKPDKKWEEYYKCAIRSCAKGTFEQTDCDNKTTFRKDELVEIIKVYFLEILKNEDNIKDLVQEKVNRLIKLHSKNNSDSYKEEIKEAEKKYKIELDLVREGLVTDKSKLRELKDKIDDLKSKQAINRISSVENYNVDEICNRLFNNIDDIIESGLLDNKDIALKLNSLFDSVISTSDGRLIFNLKASNILSKFIDSSDETLRSGNNENCLLKRDSENKQLQNTLPYGSSENCLLKYSDRQLEWLGNWGNKLVLVSLDSLFDWDEINLHMNKIRDQNKDTRLRY